MDKAFVKECNRKEKLLDLWNEFLDDYTSKNQNRVLDDLYEGMATVMVISETSISLRLEDNKKRVRIQVRSEISKLTSRGDNIYIVLGRQKGIWFAVDVISIGSVFDRKEGKAHVSFNSKFLGGAAPKSAMH